MLQTDIKTKIVAANLSWIVVNDLKKAVKHYTEVVGLKLLEFHEEFGWAELQGHKGGMRIGLAQQRDNERAQAGENAVIALGVEDIKAAHADLAARGVVFEGDMVTVPGHVKLWSFVDTDGNKMQLVQQI